MQANVSVPVFINAHKNKTMILFTPKEKHWRRKKVVAVKQDKWRNDKQDKKNGTKKNSDRKIEKELTSLYFCLLVKHLVLLCVYSRLVSSSAALILTLHFN